MRLIASARAQVHRQAAVTTEGVLQLRDVCQTQGYFGAMATTIGFRPTEEDERIIKAAMRPDEGISDVIRRALRLLEREIWLSQARSDAARLAGEDLTDEVDAW
ncbi:MAG: hypothetical protein ACRDTC_22480 [Pseudonocardiaceae bacterium]